MQADVERGYQYSSSRPIESDLYTLDPKAKYLKFQPSVRSTSLAPSQTSLGSFPPMAAPVEFLTPTRTPGKVKSIYQKCIFSISKTTLRQKPKSFISSTKRFLFATFYNMRATRYAAFVGPDPNSSEHASAPVPIPTTSKANLICNGSIDSVIKNFDVTSKDYLKTIPTHAISHNNISQPLADRKPITPVLDQVSSHERLSPLSLGPAVDGAPPHIPNCKESKVLSTSSYQSALRQLRGKIGFSKNFSSRRQSTPSATSRSILTPISEQPDLSGNQVGQGEHDELLRIEDIYSGRQDSADSASSYATNNLFSPGLASSSVFTDGMSPCHLSPPCTPDKSERGHDLLGSSRPVPNYSETQDILSSEVIENLRKSLVAANIQDKPYPGSTLHRYGSRALLTSWVDGSEHLITGLGDLLDDLRYLGDLIT